MEKQQRWPKRTFETQEEALAYAYAAVASAWQPGGTSAKDKMIDEYVQEAVVPTADGRFSVDPAAVLWAYATVLASWYRVSIGEQPLIALDNVWDNPYRASHTSTEA